MKKILLLIVALITMAVGDILSSCDESIKSDPCTFKVKIIEKWSDIGIDDYGDDRCSVTKYHVKYDFCIAEDSTHAGSDWMRGSAEIDGDTYHNYEVEKTYLIKEASLNDWEFGLSVNYNKHRLFNR